MTDQLRQAVDKVIASAKKAVLRGPPPPDVPEGEHVPEMPVRGELAGKGSTADEATT